MNDPNIQIEPRFNNRMLIGLLNKSYTIYGRECGPANMADLNKEQVSYFSILIFP